MEQNLQKYENYNKVSHVVLLCNAFFYKRQRNELFKNRFVRAN